MENDFPPGSVLDGRYLIQERCGRSRVGSVFLAEDRVESRPVILKIFSHRFIPGEKTLDFLDNLVRERRTFDHPNLIRILSSFRIPLDAGKAIPAIIMEEISARPVSEMLRNREPGARTLADVLRILLETGQAMEYLHAQGIDIVPLHPRRVFLECNEGRSRVKLPAFGYFTSAEWIRDASRWGCTTGVDYRYVAPEMLEEGSFLKSGQRADLYLFGLFAFELLVGAPPFEANRETLIQLHRTEPVPIHLLPNDTPEWLVQMISTALKKDASARPELSAMLEMIAGKLEADSAALASVALPAEGSAVRVLFVGDNRLDQLSVARMAKSERLPFHYRIAQTIEKAEEILEHREVDVIVTDHHLPDGTSFDLLKAGGLVPVIVITGSDKSDLRQAVIQAGAFACLTKDLRQAHLKSLPALLLKAHKKTM